MKKLSLFLLTLVCVFQFSAQAQERPSYIAIEANSRKLLFSSNAEAKRPVASPVSYTHLTLPTKLEV